MHSAQERLPGQRIIGDLLALVHEFPEAFPKDTTLRGRVTDGVPRNENPDTTDMNISKAIDLQRLLLVHVALRSRDLSLRSGTISVHEIDQPNDVTDLLHRHKMSDRFLEIYKDHTGSPLVAINGKLCAEDDNDPRCDRYSPGALAKVEEYLALAVTELRAVLAARFQGPTGSVAKTAYATDMMDLQKSIENSAVMTPALRDFSSGDHTVDRATNKEIRNWDPIPDDL